MREAYVGTVHQHEPLRKSEVGHRELPKVQIGRGPLANDVDAGTLARGPAPLRIRQQREHAVRADGAEKVVNSVDSRVHRGHSNHLTIAPRSCSTRVSSLRAARTESFVTTLESKTMVTSRPHNMICNRS